MLYEGNASIADRRSHHVSRAVGGGRGSVACLLGWLDLPPRLASARASPFVRRAQSRIRLSMQL
jgi:hypothetical protein